MLTAGDREDTLVGISFYVPRDNTDFTNGEGEENDPAKVRHCHQVMPLYNALSSGWDAAALSLPLGQMLGSREQRAQAEEEQQAGTKAGRQAGRRGAALQAGCKVANRQCQAMARGGGGRPG